MAENEGTLNEVNSLARVRGRSMGSLFFSIFGGLWLALSFFAFGMLTRGVELCLGILTLAFVSVALWLLGRLPRGLAPDPQRERDGRMFGWVNAVQWVSIILVYQVATRMNHQNAAFPLIVLIVGVHFFVLPRSYRMRSNLVAGAVLVMGAVVCPVLFRGDTMVGAVTLWAGVTLWASAAWALRTAAMLVRGAG